MPPSTSPPNRGHVKSLWLCPAYPLRKRAMSQLPLPTGAPVPS